MFRGFALLALVYLFVVYIIPKPDSVKPEGWRLAGIFAATIVGSITQPIPGSALVLLAVTLVGATGILKIGDALGGYADPSVWLVIAAFIISRALIDTGLARRIALQFVRLFGKSSLGVSYSLGMSDFVLAGMIPSNGARSGGVIMPIAKSIAELYGSTPGATASMLGAFLMTAAYQSVCITSAMFYTGQASNPIAAKPACLATTSSTASPLSAYRTAVSPACVKALGLPRRDQQQCRCADGEDTAVDRTRWWRSTYCR